MFNCFSDFLRGKLSLVQCHAWADSTIRTRQHQWKKYLEFCRVVNRDAIPLDMETACLFFVHLAIHGMAYKTINNEASAINVLGKLYGGGIDLRTDFGVKLTLTALRRLLGDTPNRKDELLPSDLILIYEHVNKSNFLEWSAWIGIIFLYRTMLRKGHLFPGESNSNLLARSDVSFTPYRLIVRVKKSKTIQFRQRQVDIPVCYGGGYILYRSIIEGVFTKIPHGSYSPNIVFVYGRYSDLCQLSSSLIDVKTLGIKSRT